MYERYLKNKNHVCLINEVKQSFFDKLLKRKKFKIRTTGLIEYGIRYTFEVYLFNKKVEYSTKQRNRQLSVISFYKDDKKYEKAHDFIMYEEHLNSYFYLYDLDKYDIVITAFDNLLKQLENENNEKA